MSPHKHPLLFFSLVVWSGTTTLSTGCKRQGQPQSQESSTEATASETQSTAASPSKKLAHPFLWQVKSAAGKTSHLLGTMHLGIDAEKEFDDTTWQPLSSSTHFVMELNPLDPAALTMGKRTDGGTLADELGPETWALMQKHLGASAAALENMTAATAAMMLMIQGLPMTPPMDFTLFQKATDAKKELVFLETLAMQKALLEELMTVDYIRAMLENFDEVKKSNQELLAAYRAGDEGKLLALVQKDLPWGNWTPEEVEAMRDKLLYQRNANWIPLLEPLLNQGDVFVAVGAAHLPGARGVNQLLTERGFTVTRIGAPANAATPDEVANDNATSKAVPSANSE